MPDTPLDPYDLFAHPDRAGGDEWVWRIEAPHMLVVESGHVVVCDPLTGIDEPLARAVEPGRYRIELAVADLAGDQHVGAARLVLRDEQPVRWEMAARKGERLDTLRAGQRVGYGVDSGTGCFADAGVEIEDAAADVLLRALEKNMRPTWSHAAWPSKRNAALVAFSAGYGDGVYASYWGLDAKGEPVCLVTDFGVTELTWPEPEDRPDVRAAYVREQMARLRVTKGFEGYAIAQEVGALGEEAREFAAELLGMLRDPARADIAGAIERALGQIAREAPEVGELAAEMWSRDDAHAPAYLSIALRARQLSPRTRHLLQRVANDRDIDDDQREAALGRLTLELDTRDAEALLDTLSNDPSPAVRSASLSHLRESEPPAVWAARVEHFVGDRSPEVRTKLAQELGARTDEVNGWVPVLAPMLADMDEAVQVAAAGALAWSDSHWRLAVEVFARTLAGEELLDDMGNSAHASVLWSLAQGRVPKDIARALVAPHRARLGDHPAIAEIFGAPDEGSRPRRARAKPKKTARASKPAKAASKKKPAKKSARVAVKKPAKAAGKKKPAKKSARVAAKKPRAKPAPARARRGSER